MDGGNIEPDTSELGGAAGLPTDMQLPAGAGQQAPATGGNG